MPDETNSKKGRAVPEGTDVPKDKVCDCKDGHQPPPEGEVTGHRSSGSNYICFAGDWSGWIPAGWDYFICPYGHLNYV